MAALRGVKTQHQPNSLHGIRLQIFHKNARSLRHDDRLHEVMIEALLFDMEWNVILFSETWRDETREYFSISDGHVFCGFGGVSGSRGVACIINRKWVSYTAVCGY